MYSVEDGSYIDGYFNATFDGNSTAIAANATAEDMRLALESIGTGSLSVTRSGERCFFFFCCPVGVIVVRRGSPTWYGGVT